MIYVLLADGFEEIEALAFTDILRRAGIDVQTVSVNASDKLVSGAHSIKVLADVTADSTDMTKAEAIVLPGGVPGVFNLKDSKKVKEFLDYAVNNELTVGAICAAPYILDSFGYLNGKSATVNPDFESKMENAELVNKRVVIDGQFITSKGPGTAHEFAHAFIERFKDKKTADTLIEKMLYIK